MNYSNESNMRHQQAWELLPWFVNGTASEEECRLVETHLKQCEDCREELAFQRRLHAGMALDAATAAPDPTPGLERLLERIDNVSAGDAAEEPQRAFATFAKSATTRGRRPWLGYALAAMVVLQAGVLGVLGAQFLMQDRTGDMSAAYTTLSSPETNSPQATIRIVSAPSMRMDELTGILRQLQLQIVAGPTEAGVYSLAPTTGQAEQYDRASQIARLRASASIRFAEPAGGSNGAP